MHARATAVLLLLALTAGAQQPNGAAASMTIGGIAGPPYPIPAGVRTGSPATFALSGAPGARIIVALSATGSVQPGALATAGGLVDLPLAPPPLLALDGTTNPQFALDATGSFSFVVPVPPAGNPPAGIPLGHQEAVQAAIADPASPAGFALTAATQVTVVQGPFVTDLVLGDDGAAAIDVGVHGFSIPFYGAGYTQLWICVNGFLTFGLPDTDFTPTALDFNVGYPRLAPFWTDLEQNPGEIVRITIDPNPPGGQAPFVRADWIGVPDWGGQGFVHTFSASVDAAGLCVISLPLTNAASVFSTICGIGPGGGLNPQAMKDLSAIQAGGGASGAALESHFEWFGLLSMFGYPGPTDRPFDLFGATLHFLPAAAGGLPAATSAYSFY